MDTNVDLRSIASSYPTQTFTLACMINTPDSVVHWLHGKTFLCSGKQNQNVLIARITEFKDLTLRESKVFLFFCRFIEIIKKKKSTIETKNMQFNSEDTIKGKVSEVTQDVQCLLVPPNLNWIWVKDAPLRPGDALKDCYSTPLHRPGEDDGSAGLSQISSCSDDDTTVSERKGSS